MIQDWLEERKVRKLVMVLASVETKETLERWEFNVEYEADGDDKENLSSNKNKNYRDKTDKDEKKIKQEIREVIRQITASVTFLPLLDCICSFDVLVIITQIIHQRNASKVFGIRKLIYFFPLIDAVISRVSTYLVNTVHKLFNFWLYRFIPTKI